MDHLEGISDRNEVEANDQSAERGLAQVRLDAKCWYVFKHVCVCLSVERVLLHDSAKKHYQCILLPIYSQLLVATVEEATQSKLTFEEAGMMMFAAMTKVDELLSWNNGQSSWNNRLIHLKKYLVSISTKAPHTSVVS